MTDLSVPVPIVDDVVNEAGDQFFIAYLQLEDNIRDPMIDRSVSYCIIVDNDREYNK